MKHPPKTRRGFCLTEALEPRRLLSAGLAVTYATNSTDLSGLSTLSYNGTQLINDSTSNEEFQVDRYYTLNSSGTYTAVGGETGFTSNWNTQTDTLTYTYSWGTLTCQYLQAGNNRFNMVFGVNNAASSGVTLGGVDIYPAYIHFPFTVTPSDEQQIVNSSDPAAPAWYPEVAYGLDGPAVLPADYSDAPTDDGAVMVLANDGPATTQMYTSLWTTNYTGSTPGKDYFIFAGTAPKDTMLADQASDPETYTDPLFYTNTAAGQSDNFEISLRFGPAGTNATSLATDIENNYAAAYPQLANWPDNRPIASLHLASEGSATSTNPNAWVVGGYDGNPVNVTTTGGLNNFSAGVLSYAAGSIAQMTLDHSQGMIVWDLEGEGYSQPNPTYIGDPILATTIAPEWSFNYQNKGPLINQFFSAFTSAGFRVGMTLRPTAIEFVNGVPSQTPNDGVGSVPIAQEITNLEAKIAYAYGQWGATLFYIDSTTGFDAAALRTVQQAFPNVLLIPEHSTISTYGTSAAYGELTNDFTGTPANVLATYPTAISVIYIADGDMTGGYSTALISALAHGDIMLFRGWYADPNNAVMVQDYQAAMAVPAQTSLSAIAADGVVNLAWSPLGTHVVYNILRSSSQNGPYLTIASGVFGSVYADTSVSNYQTYYYQVTGVDGAGNGPASVAVSATPQGPTVTNAASASPSPVTGTTANLSVLGSEQGNGSGLTYTWSGASTPADAPPATFSANGTNLADNTTVHFYQAGSYLLTAKITDPMGYSATSSVTVLVNQTPQTLYVLPPKLTISGGGSQQFTVSSTDQFSDTIFSPAVTWSVNNGGAISSTGLFSANQPAGTYTVTAISGALTASTTVTVLATAAPVLELSSVSVANQLINIGNGDLIIPDAGPAGLAQVQREIQTGADLEGGYWNGSFGITSSSAASDTTYLTAVGVMLNNNGNTANPGPIYTSFDGIPTGLNDVLVKFTYYGDANLDGKVDASDYSLIDNGYLNHLTGWYNGDFNYDGVINGSDYTLIDNAYNRQGSSLGTSTPAAEIDAQIDASRTFSGTVIVSPGTNFMPTDAGSMPTDYSEQKKKRVMKDFVSLVLSDEAEG